MTNCLKEQNDELGYTMFTPDVEIQRVLNQQKVNRKNTNKNKKEPNSPRRHICMIRHLVEVDSVLELHEESGGQIFLSNHQFIISIEPYTYHYP